MDLCYSSIQMMAGVLNIPRQCAVLQCGHQCGLFNVIICNPLCFPYCFHYEPKSIGVFVSDSFEYRQLDFVCTLNHTPCSLYIPCRGKINPLILLKLLLLMILLRKLLCGFVVANSCIYLELNDKPYDLSIFNFFLFRVLAFQHQTSL